QVSPRMDFVTYQTSPSPPQLMIPICYASGDLAFPTHKDESALQASPEPLPQLRRLRGLWLWSEIRPANAKDKQISSSIDSLRLRICPSLMAQARLFLRARACSMT